MSQYGDVSTLYLQHARSIVFLFFIRFCSIFLVDGFKINIQCKILLC